MLIAALSVAAASAADGIPERLSLKEAVAIALRTHPSLKQSEKNYENAISGLIVASHKTSLDAGGSVFLRRESGSSDTSGRVFGGFSYEDISGIQGAADISPFSQGSESSSVSLSLRQPLTARRGVFSSKGLSVASAMAQTDIREKELFITRQSLVYSVIRAYLRVLLSAGQVNVQERASQIAEEAAGFTRRRADEGLVTEYEASQAELNAAHTKNQLNNQRQAYKGAMEDLMIAMGGGVGQVPELTDPVPSDDIQVPDLTTALETALRNRSELAVYDTRLDDQSLRVGAAGDDMRPRTDAVLRFRSLGDDSGILSSSLLDNGSLTAGVEYSFSIDKKILEHRRDNAERDLDVIKLLRLYETERVAEEVRSAHRAVESARLSLDIYGRNVALAEENLRLSQRMMEEDLGTIRDVLDAQASLTRVEGGRLSALVDLYLASVNLKHSMGEDLAAEMLK